MLRKKIPLKIASLIYDAPRVALEYSTPPQPGH